MSAMTQDRNTTRRDAEFFAFPVAAATKIHGGAVVALDATGFALPGEADPALVAVGIAQEAANNLEGAAGAILVKVRRGCFLLKNDSTDALSRAQVGQVCFLVDDQTVAKTDDTGALSAAGIVRDVEENGVWVEF